MPAQSVTTARSSNNNQSGDHTTVRIEGASPSITGPDAVTTSSSDDPLSHVFTRKELMDLDPRIEWRTPDSLRKGHHSCLTLHRIFLDSRVEVEVARFGHPDDFLLAPAYIVAFGAQLLALALVVDVTNPSPIFLTALGFCAIALAAQWLLCFKFADTSTHDGQNIRTNRHIWIQTVFWTCTSLLLFAGRSGTSLCIVDASQDSEWPHHLQCDRRYSGFLMLTHVGLATFVRSPPWCLSMLVLSLAMQFIGFVRNPQPSWTDFGYTFSFSVGFALVCAVGNWYRDYAVRWHFASIVTVVAARKEARIQRHDFASIIQFAVPYRLLERLASGQKDSNSRGLSDWSTHAAVAMTATVDLGNRSSSRLIMKTLESLHNAFTIFDAAARDFGVDRVAVFGDCYVVTTGLIGSALIDLPRICRFVDFQLKTIGTAVKEGSKVAALLHSCICTGAVRGEMSGGSLFYYVHGEAVDRCSTLLPSVPRGTCWVDRVTGQQLPSDCEFFAGAPKEVLPGAFASALLVRITNNNNDDKKNTPKADERKEPPTPTTKMTRDLEHKLGLQGLPDPADVAISQVTAGGNFTNPTDEESYRSYAASTVTSRAPLLFSLMSFIAFGFLVILIVSRTKDATVSYADDTSRDIACYVLIGFVAAASFWLGVASIWWPTVRRKLRGCCTRQREIDLDDEQQNTKFTNFSNSTDQAKVGDDGASDASGFVVPQPRARSFAKSLAMLKSKPSMTQPELNLDSSLQEEARQLDPFKLPDDSDEDITDGEEDETVSSDHHDAHGGVTTTHKFNVPTLIGARFIGKSVNRTIAMWFFLTITLTAALLPLQRTVISTSAAFVSGSIGVMSAAFILRTWRWWSAALITNLVVVLPATIATYLHVGRGPAPLIDSVVFVAVILVAARAGPQRARNAFGLALHVSVSLETVMNNTKQLQHLAAEHVPAHIAERALRSLRYSTILYHKNGKSADRISRNVDVCEFFGDYVYVMVRLSPTATTSPRGRHGSAPVEAGTSQPLSLSGPLARDSYQESSAAPLSARHFFESESSRNPLSEGAPISLFLEDVSEDAVHRSPITIVRHLIAEYGGGHLTFLQALGDEFCLGGPAQKGDDAIQSAAEAVIRCLRAVREALPQHTFVAAGCVEEAAGAIVGAQSLRYRVYGVATRHARALLHSGLNALIPGSFGRLQLLYVTRRLHNMLAASSQTSLSGARWLSPAKWRTKDTGVTPVYTLDFNGDTRREL